MRVIVCENYEEMSKKAASIVAAQIMLKPASVLGLATGSTPVGMYNKLAEMCKNGDADFSLVTSFNLDEYYPIKKDNEQSYYRFMYENLFSKVNINLENTHIPNGETDDPQTECENYEKMIKAAGGVDLQILGIGQNGHIGFNEPDANLNSCTHLTGLTDNTIKANSRFFDSYDEVPKKALTMGISTILSAKKIILLASGSNKSRVVSALLKGGINTSVPATMLKTHPDVILICDRDAYSGARLGVDLGGTNIKFAVVDEGVVKHKCSIPTADTCEGIISDITESIKKLTQEFNIKNVGMGTPGIIKEGLVTCANLPFDKVPLEKLISEKTKMPVCVDNDANCAALGEISFGNVKDCGNIVLVTLGTGIGGGIIMNSQICRSNNNLGEIGHMMIQAENGKKCPCGQSGCWERYCSMTALAESAEEYALANTDSILYNMYKENGNKANGKIVFDAMEKGCKVASEVFDKFLSYLAFGIENLANIFGPDAIVLAGGVTVQGDKLLKPLKEKIRKDIRIEISSLQGDAGALGASLL